MRNKQIILIDGMSGIGKSTLAQQIFFCIKNNSESVEWFHEEESRHPIYQKQFEKLLENGNCFEYKNQILDQWNSFLNSNIKQTVILESQISLIFVASMLWNNISKDDIKNYTYELLSLLNTYPLKIIFLQTNKPENIIKHTIRIRGNEWKKWYLNYFNNSRYAQSRSLFNIKGISIFWKEVSELMLDVFALKNLSINCYCISNLNYNLRNKQILKYFIHEKKISNLKISKNEVIKYCGHFSDPDNKTICLIYFRNNKLLCNFGWPDLELIKKYQADEFYIRSFPHELKFINLDKIEIIGKDIAGLKGKILIRQNT